MQVLVRTGTGVCPGVECGPAGSDLSFVVFRSPEFRCVVQFYQPSMGGSVMGVSV